MGLAPVQPCPLACLRALHGRAGRERAEGIRQYYFVGDRFARKREGGSVMTMNRLVRIVAVGLAASVGCGKKTSDRQGDYFEQRSALSTWSVGLNEIFIQEYLEQQGLTACAQCPKNARNRTLNEINCRVLDLAGSRHVGVYREIIPLYMVQPVSNFNDPTNLLYRQKIFDVLQKYAAYNVNLILSFGGAFPQWMSPQFDRLDGNWCPWPAASDSATFETLKNNMSWAIGNLINDMKNRGIPALWIQNSLFIEGLNEFDATQGRRFVNGAWICTGDPPDPGDPPYGTHPYRDATPARAASLQGGINFVLNSYGIANRQTSPSVAGYFPFGLPTVADNIGRFLSDYYANAGEGYPSLHFYWPDISEIANALNVINGYVPAQWQNQLVLSETGQPEYNPTDCGPEQPGLPVRDFFYRDLAADPTITARTMLLAFWRTMDLGGGCEFGVTTADNRSYKPVGNNLFAFLGGTPGNGSAETCLQ
jgi:hypothetical protein